MTVDKSSATVDKNMRGAKIIAKGAGISLVGTVLNRGFHYFFQVISAQYLGEATFGLFTLGLALVNLVSILAILGLHQGGLRYIARYRALGDIGSEYKLARRLPVLVTIWGGLVGVGMSVMAEPLAAAYRPDIPELPQIIGWFAPAVPFAALVLLLSSMAEGKRRIDYGVFSRDLTQPISAFVLGWVFLRAGMGLAGVIQGYTLSMILATLLAFFLLRGYFFRAPKKIQESNFSMAGVIGFSLPFLPMMLLRQFGNRLEIYMLGLLGTPEEVGIFGVAAATAILVTFGLQAVWRIYAAMASELYAKKDFLQLEHHLKLATRWSTAISLPALLAILLFSEDVLRMFGRNFALGSTTLIILAIGQCINAATGPVGVTLNMAGYSRLSMINNFFAVGLNIVVDYYLILEYGIVGAAVGSAIVMVLLNIVVMFEVRHLLKIVSFDPRILRLLLVFAITFAFMWLIVGFLGDLHYLARLFTGSAVLGVIYLGFYWIFAPEEDRELARASVRRVRAMIKR